MDRAVLRDFHYITPLVNIPSILVHGILAHNRVQSTVHETISTQDVRDIRSGKVVPSGQELHDYANLYFDARNPMMYIRRALHIELCVLCISSDVVDLPGVVVTDGNAASTFTRFAPAPDG